MQKEVDALDVDAISKFNRDVFGFSFLYRKWDHIYTFGRMETPRMLHRFGNTIDLKSTR